MEANSKKLFSSQKFSDFVDFMRVFYNGRLYPLILFFVTLISHSLSIELFGIVVFLILLIPGFLICSDFKFLIMPFIVSLLMFSEKSVRSNIFYGKAYLIAITCGIIAGLMLLVAHFIIYRKSTDFKAFVKSKLFLGLLLFTFSIFLNGFFNFENYHHGNISYAFAFTFALTGVFFLFSIGLTPNTKLINYLLNVLFLTSILVALEFFIGFINQFQIENGQIVKESIMLGWGMWNNIGGLLAFLLPVHFYFATKIHRYGWVFYLTGLFTYGAIILTLSRSSLLSATITLIICVAISSFCGVNKRINRIFSISLLALAILFVIIFWSKISNILGDYLSRGLDDNGRFVMYKHGFMNFLSHPFFGGGFNSAYKTEHTFIFFLPPRYHNTFVQMIGTCGLLGISAYVFHRYQTINLLFSKKRLSFVFAALAIGTMLFGSMFDNHLFNIHPTFIYAILLVCIEKSNASLK